MKESPAFKPLSDKKQDDSMTVSEPSTLKTKAVDRIKRVNFKCSFKRKKMSLVTLHKALRTYGNGYLIYKLEREIQARTYNVNQLTLSGRPKLTKKQVENLLG